MGFGWLEILIILGILLLLFGSKKLPQLARSLGESFNVLKQEVNNVKKPLEETPSSLTKDVVDDEGEVETMFEED